MRRILGFVLVGLFLLAAVGWGFVRSARRRAAEGLDAMLARHATQGLLVRWEDAAAELPATSPECADARYEWSRRTPPTYLVVDWTSLVDGATPDLSADLATLESARAWLEELSALQDRCPGSLTSAGLNVTNLAGDLPEWGLSMRTPNLLAMRLAAGGAALRAVSATDPAARASALDDLDRVVSAFRPSHCLIDAMIALAIQSVRCDTYGHLALRGRLDPRRVESWVDERARPFEDVADGMRGERLLFALPLLRRVTEGGTVPSWIHRPSWAWDAASIWRDHVAQRWLALEDGALLLEAHAAVERWLRTGEEGEAAAAAVARAAEPAWPFDHLVPSFGPCARAAVDVDQRQRSVRVAALLTASVRRGETLPEDDAAARARLGERAAWLDAHPRGYRLRYERLDDDAFRVVVDPATPVPALLGTPGGRLPAGDLAPTVGAPRSPHGPGHWLAQWGVRVALKDP